MLLNVAPFAGAWIEISVVTLSFIASQSLPSRERGLKYRTRCIHRCLLSVAPFAGAWIEMTEAAVPEDHPEVAPFAGAWIEMKMGQQRYMTVIVAPFAGAWIEIDQNALQFQQKISRSLRGSVD